MSYNNYRHQDNRHRLQDFTPRASQPPTTSYISPSYRQHTPRYATTAPQSDVPSRWSDTNSTTNLSETTSLTESEKERLVHEETEGDRRRYEQWKKWARERKEEYWKEWAREQEREDRLKSAAANARRQERRYRLQVLERQIREYEDLILEADRKRKEADGQRREADRRAMLRTSSSDNNHSRSERATRYAVGTSDRRLLYTHLSDEALIGIAKECEKRSERSWRH